MAEAATFTVFAFQPYNGGDGGITGVTTTSARFIVPGMQGGQAQPGMRVLVTNGGLVSAFVKLGGANVVATTATAHCGLEILPGGAYLLTPPDVAPQDLYIAAITLSGTTNISACAGVGT